MIKAKDFQQATVEKVIEAFRTTNIYLVADEVGLGKTIVAKEIIRRMYHEHKSRKKPFHVIYICSNLVLADQNVRKLGPNPKEHSNEGIGRLLLLAKKWQTNDSHKKNKKTYMVSTLTPSTSFQMKNSKGIAEERAVLYRVLKDKAFQGITRSKERDRSLKKMLQGGCSDDKWRWWTGPFQGQFKLQPELAAAFRTRISENGLLNRLYKYLDKQGNDTEKELIRELRDALTNICAENYLQADLFVLDEFQRFRDLIDRGKDRTQAAILAEKVFRSGKKILLLSATPFKPYSTYLDSAIDDDHYKNFNLVLDFLLQRNRETLSSIKEYRKKYFMELTGWSESKNASNTAKDLMEIKRSLETGYGRCMSRTERSIVEERDMIQNGKGAQEIRASMGDVQHFMALDGIYRKLEGKINGNDSALLEFSATSPWALSYLKGYKIRDGVNARINELIGDGANSAATLSYEKVNKYDRIFYEYTNHGRMNLLLNECLYNGGSDLLWIPPSLPYYLPDGPYEGMTGYSKTLLFSSWVMAPKAISTLLSYEAERLSIGSEDDKRTSSYGPKAYFEKDRQRSPKPQLIFTTQEGKDHFTNACLLYPSKYLAEILEDHNIIKDGVEKSPAIKKRIVQSITKDHQELLAQAKGRGGRQQYWYWYVLFYLAHIRGEGERNDYWLDDESFYTAEEDNEDATKKVLEGKRKFIEELAAQVKAREKSVNVANGVPVNLGEIIADMALGSPAVCAYRMLKNLFPRAADDVIVSSSTKIAGGFFTLFNKPEAIAIIRRTIPGNLPYWHKSYCMVLPVISRRSSMNMERC